MSNFVPRLIAPDVATNKYYRYPYDPSQGVYVYGGVNTCIVIDPTTGAVMPNCVGYAWGRCYELLGSAPALSRGDAYTWWSYNDGYERSPLGPNGYAGINTPRLGAIVCTDYGNPGHVAVVEKKNSDGSWEISESRYGGAFFLTGTIAWSQSAQKWFCWYDDGHGGSENLWDVKGFIYPPYDWYNTGTFKFVIKKRKKQRRLIYV